ncbi:hypothetical protein [Polymorphum gilvum]|nr:hypothetical protein [Polymorphum gilvum]
MSSISGGSSAEFSSAGVRAELASRFVRDAATADRQVVKFLEGAKQPAEDAARRESRKIPGLGNAVDISA